MPASGVLKAPAMPAADPARISARSRGMRPSRAVASMMPAPICTVGPSRPTDAPQTRPRTVRTILVTQTRVPRSRPRPWAERISLAAIACGMPLPPAAGATRWVRSAQTRKPVGVTTKGNHHTEART